MIVVDNLARHPALITKSVDLAWSEWGAGLAPQEYQRWLHLAEQDCHLNTSFSAAFVAVADGVLAGVVSVHEFDIDAMHDRSPWVCGMVVKPEYRGQGVGRRLLQALEAFAAGAGIARLWVFTETATGFYERCGWVFHAHALQQGAFGTVLIKDLEGV